MASTETTIFGHDGSVDRKVRTDTGGFLQTSDSVFRIRDSVKTAYATITNGTEQTLLAGTSGKYHDLIQISLSNSSSVAQNVTLKDDGTTVQIFRLGANTSYNFNLEHQIPANDKNRAWTIDGADDNNSTVYVQALFIEQ